MTRAEIIDIRQTAGLATDSQTIDGLVYERLAVGSALCEICHNSFTQADCILDAIITTGGSGLAHKRCWDARQQ